ncbi:hypothetical protein [Burkholderia cepacia]|uniref:hypothetical protein n=1 Tax=Burkholderia cepacia TaxID=292 RepID=UPI002654F808|nr:hypothetical protein [Burkholderia cepacia]MDN7900134.1 hypothetical protein [Burkholderia cepacia]
MTKNEQNVTGTYSPQQVAADLFRVGENPNLPAWQYPVLQRAIGLLTSPVEQPATAPIWRCFHCDEAFTDSESAALHFGTSERQSPACTIDVAEYRAMEQRMHAYNEEDTELHRAVYCQQAQHQTELQRQEEKGYARGLADGMKEATNSAPSPADKRATWDDTRHSLAVAMCGFATRLGSRDLDAAISVLDAITEAGSPLSWLRSARAASSIETVAEGFTYATTQATACASCGEHKHTPLRVDQMGGYVCLTCIDRELERSLDLASDQRAAVEFALGVCAGHVAGERHVSALESLLSVAQEAR